MPAGLAEPLPIAREHLEIRQQVVRPQYRLGAPHVCITGNRRAGVRLPQIEQRAHQAAQQGARAVAFLAQPESRIERNLLVAAAAGVDFIGHGAGALLQLPYDQRVNVLVRGAFVEPRRGGFFAYLVERGNDGLALRGGQDAHPLQRPREGLRTPYIGVDQAPVEVQRSRKAFEDLGRPGFKSAAPELHLDCAALAARTLIGRPIRLMKPSASFWS